MAICNCPSEEYVLSTVDGVSKCTKTTTITNVVCPANCQPILLPDGNVKCDCNEIVAPTVVDKLTPIELTNPTYFKDISFTIAYSPILEKWISYYSFAPNYYIAHQNYFQTGINTAKDATEQGLWSHLLTTQSYQVFYGKKCPFILDYTTKTPFTSKLVDSINFNLNVRRYHDRYDWAEMENKPMSAITVYNNIANSGELRMVNNTGNLNLLSQYPKTALNGKSQEILTTYKNEQWFVNYFYNRVLDNNLNKPLWLWDENQVNKTINTDVVKFSGKPVLENMKGLYMNVRLTQDVETRFQYVYRFGMANEKPE